MKNPPFTEMARVIRIKIMKGKTGLFYATSPDLRGLLIAQPTLDALKDEIPLAIAALYQASDMTMLIVRAKSNDTNFHMWVAMSEDFVRRAIGSTVLDVLES
jgi:hypothetical protein